MSGIGEPLREMASALVDGEASEFERRRVLENMQDGELGALLGRHYTVRTLLRREAPALCPESLAGNIVAAIEAEPALSGSAARPAVRWRGWAGGAAVAASVCLLAVGAVRGLQQPQEPAAPAVAATGAVLGTLGTPARQLVPASAGAVPVGFGASTPGSAEQAARQRLHWYMVEQAQNAALNNPQGMMPFARVASYEEP